MRLFATKLQVCAGMLACLALGITHACEKKGVGFVRVPFMDAAALLKTMNAHWYYDWKSHPVDGSGDVPFVPMVRNGNRVDLETDLKVISGRGVVPLLLGFNEPDLVGKAHEKITPDEGVALWQPLEHYAVRLGSPAVSGEHPEWLDRFMSQVEQKRLKVDFIAIHYYGAPDARAFLGIVDDLHQKYHRPIWVTEFAVKNKQWRSNSGLYSPQDALQFMRAVLPELERRPYVERFAWWGIGGQHPERLSSSRFFNDDGTLTDVGRFYAAFEATSHEGLCGATP